MWVLLHQHMVSSLNEPTVEFSNNSAHLIFVVDNMQQFVEAVVRWCRSKLNDPNNALDDVKAICSDFSTTEIGTRISDLLPTIGPPQDQETVMLSLTAQAADSYYSKLVVGAAVGIGLER
jgi:hypothetical protein